jgi:senataxin
LKNDFDDIIHLLRNCQVDGSVLTKIDIVNLMKEIKDSDIIRATCGSIKLDLQDILKSWKARIKYDNKASVVADLQGGHIAEVPGVAEVRAQPEHVTADFWKQVLKRYNDSQIWVIKNSCFHDGQDINIHLVQGPPGTGKTHTIMGMISTILSQDNTVTSDVSPRTTRQRIILCAPSNAAVDELLRRLTFGILGLDGEWRPCNVVRLGKLAETTTELYEKLLPFTVQHKVDKLIKNSEFSVKLDEVLEKIRTSLDKLSRVDASTDITLHKTKIAEIDQTLRLLKAERARIEHEIELLRVSGTKQVISEAEVVISTLGSSGSYMFTDIVAVDDMSFDVAIIDEAGQATEPSTLIPLRYGCRKLILVGDPRQLPATGANIILVLLYLII